MGRDPAPGAFSAPGQTLDDRPRLCRLDGGARDRRGGNAVEIGRSGRYRFVHARRPLRTRRLQRRSPQLPAVGRPAPPADPARRCTLSRLGIAATRVPAPVLRARHARHRQARDEMPDALRFESEECPSSSRRRPGPTVQRFRHLLRSVSPFQRWWTRAAERWTPASAGATMMLAIGVSCLGGVPTAAAETIYVSNEKDNTITLVDGKTLEATKTIPVGQRPRGILLSKDEKSLYVCASDSDHIEVLDLADDKVARILPSGADPEYFALDPAGKLLYVANEDDNLVTVVDIERGEVVTEIPVGVEPEGMGISPNGKYLVNTSETTNMAHVIDTAKREVVANILVDSRPRRAVWTADGAQFWVSAEIGGTVSVIDADKREIVRRITFAVPGVPAEAIQPVVIAITPYRKLAFVALGPANRVAVIDAQSYEVVRYLLVGQRVWSLAFNPDQSRLYTTNGVSNDITVIDVGSLKAIKSVPVGQSPWGVVSRP